MLIEGADEGHESFDLGKEVSFEDIDFIADSVDGLGVIGEAVAGVKDGDEFFEKSFKMGSIRSREWRELSRPSRMEWSSGAWTSASVVILQPISAAIS